MTPTMSWFLVVLALLGFVLTVNQLGVNMMSDVGSVLHGAEQFLGRPLVLF